MQVVLSERVKIKLLTSTADEQKRVRAWFEYLKNWDTDPFARSRSAALEIPGQEVYVFRTTTDLYIFYTMDVPNQTITVVDLAPRETILQFGPATAEAQ